MLKKLFILITFIIQFNITSYSQFLVDTSKRTPNIITALLSNDQGIMIENPKYTGNKYSLGIFKNYCSDIQIQKGIILSTGDIWDASGPNDKPNCGNYHYFKGDAELNKIANGNTYDAAILEFDFIANTDSIVLSYLFASEEYPEFVNRGVNDVFAFFISDSAKRINIAMCNNKPITINNINSKNNNSYYIANPERIKNNNNCLSNFFQFDGLTTKLDAGLKLLPYHKYHFKICIADVGDGYFDSVILLCSNSFKSKGKTQVGQLAENLKIDLNTDYLSFNSDSSNISIIPNIQFEFDSYSIPDTSIHLLNRLIKRLNIIYDYKLTINGYSDNIGKDEYNLNLSYKRAQSIAEYLIKNNIDQKRIEINGLGKNEPIANNNDMLGRTKNRRVLFKLHR